MIRDELTTFANGTALNTGAAGSYVLGNTIDLQVARDIGNQAGLYLVIGVATTATSGGSATASFSLVSDAVDPPVPGTATVHTTSPVFAVADMAAGTTLLVVQLPLEGNEYERYLGIVQTTGTAAFTAGAVNAYMTPTPQRNKAYADYDGLT